MMRYSDLIQFEPIETVVQLRAADTASEAERLVRCFVISERMAELLADLIFPQLAIDRPADAKGMLVVGNYGTGKSHLMAFVSALAERSDLRPLVAEPGVADAALGISGRFKVVRIEIGAITMGLRGILTGGLEDALDGMGVSFRFPEADTVSNNKDAFHEMMNAFGQAFPDQGLLLVVDELLDYLKTRKGADLLLDLNFLREIGEICQSSRFRFMAGVQESLFDSPKFQFVAETLRRVQDRFEQARIAREDVAHVLATRLLRKGLAQQALVRDHLEKFAPLYGGMTEKLDDFVRLFPVHPAFLEVFERLYLAEKREVLKTISGAIRRLIDQPVPTDSPGLIAFDSYWQTLKDNSTFRAVPEIREVIQKTDVLEERIRVGLSRPAYAAVALRIIHGLAVHRLTTGDIYAPLGITPEELRDGLTLLLPIPERSAEFLKTMVETVLREILKTVNGQFIGNNRDNGQYYLDLKKDVDFDSLIARKAEDLDDDQLDRACFEALARVMDCAAQSWVAGAAVWEHEIEWRERRAKREGYLFFGLPAQRDTARPPRDFYLYVLPVFNPPGETVEMRPDEVFFRLTERAPAFETALKLYAAARDLANLASGSNRRIFQDKATDHLKILTAWMRESMPAVLQVACQGRGRALAELIPGGLADRQQSVRDLIDHAASLSLAPHFESSSPDYPVFSILITRANRAQAAQEALRWIGGGTRGRQGTAVLEALGLLDGERLKPEGSRYARQVLDALDRKGPGQVLNRSELVGDEQGVEFWTAFRLEPEFLTVILAALVHSGDLVVVLPGGRLDAGAVDRFGKLTVAELRAFRHVERPRDLPLAALQELFDLFGLPRGLIVDPAAREREAITQLQMAVARWQERLVPVQQPVQAGLEFWGRPVFSTAERDAARAALTETKTFLDGLVPFNTTGKLKNFRLDAAAVRGQGAGLTLVKTLEEIGSFVQRQTPAAGWLTIAEAVLPEDHSWRADARAAQASVAADLADPARRADPAVRQDIEKRLAALREGYRQAYLALHKRARLGVQGERRRTALLQDTRLAVLDRLSAIDNILQGRLLTGWKAELGALTPCYALTKPDLETSPLCPHCGFRPVAEPARAAAADKDLEAFHDRLDRLTEDWTATLLTNLEAPEVRSSLDLLRDGKAEITAFLACRHLPDPVTPTFVAAVKTVLSGLHKVVLKSGRLQAALLGDGVPASVAELRRRFDAYLAELTRGQDVSKVRVVGE